MASQTAVPLVVALFQTFIIHPLRFLELGTYV